MVLPAQHRLEARKFSKPESFESLEASLIKSRRDGDYKTSARLQAQLEKLKVEEDGKHHQALADKLDDEARALLEKQEAETGELMELWNGRLAHVAQQAIQQEAAMQERHVRELKLSAQVAQQAMPNPKWSSELLNMRSIESHLIRQRDFKQAAKVKADADAMANKEIAQSENSYWCKVSVEEGKLLNKQAREQEAQKTKQSAVRDEVVLSQGREHSKMCKRFQAARKQLENIHTMETLNLEAALKAWYSPKKFAVLRPSPLVPASPLSVSLMTPSLKLSIARSAYYSELSSMQASQSSSVANGTTSKDVQDLSSDAEVSGIVKSVEDGQASGASPSPNAYLSGLRKGAPSPAPGAMGELPKVLLARSGGEGMSRSSSPKLAALSTASPHLGSVDNGSPLPGSSKLGSPKVGLLPSTIEGSIKSDSSRLASPKAGLMPSAAEEM